MLHPPGRGPPVTSAGLPPARVELDLHRSRLDNGLRVVVDVDPSAPVAGVSVCYDVGFRSEPEGRSGFAHLFEHLMFEGSEHLGPGEHARIVQANGGTFNGSTHADHTSYYEAVPVSALDLVLFAEADRMRAPLLTAETLRNQIDVVSEEIRVNVTNRPYGGFPWIPLPGVLFDRWNNAHNGYGSFEDLRAATVEDARDFFDRYYCPANATLAVVGDVDPHRTLEIVADRFGSIPPRPAPPLPELSEPLVPGVRRATMVDPLAPLPALAVGLRMPDPQGELDDFLAAALALGILANGTTSRLHVRLVRTERTATHTAGQVGLFGDLLDSRDPTLAVIVIHHPAGTSPERLVAAVDEEIDRLATGVDDEDLGRRQVSVTAGWSAHLDGVLGRAIDLAVLEQQRSDPWLLATVPDRLAACEPADVRRVVRRWWVEGTRAVLEWRPGDGAVR